MAQPNPYLLAADNSPSLLPLLRSNPSLASAQDEHGYSLLHAAASYRHIDLLRALVREFKVDVNLKDEDGETCLFVTEDVAIAKCLVEELGADPNVKNDDGFLAQETIEEDGSFPEVSAYLTQATGHGASSSASDSRAPPPLPPNVRLDVETVPNQNANEELPVLDPEFKRRIDELAARDNFHSEEGQEELRALITEAVRGVGAETQQREVRRRVE